MENTICISIPIEDGTGKSGTIIFSFALMISWIKIEIIRY